MAVIYNIRNLLRTNGTNQLQRRPAALDPFSVQVEDRNFKDFLDLAYDLAAVIRYYDLNDTEDGNWQAFFSDLLDPATGRIRNLGQLETQLQNQSDLTPHLALFITFLKLIDYLNQDLNQLPKRHLDHYFGNILKVDKKPARADKVHVIFELAKGVNQELLQAGTKLDAGKDENGNPLIYVLERDIVVNRAKIEALQSLYISHGASGFHFHKAPVANSKDGLGAPLENELGQWKPFGENQLGKAPTDRTMVDTQVGFAIASPQLILREGDRVAVINLTLDDPEGVYPVFTLNGAVEVFYTSEEGWTPVTKMISQVFEQTTELKTVSLFGVTSLERKFISTRLVTNGSTSGQISGGNSSISFRQGPLARTRVKTNSEISANFDGTAGTTQKQEKRIVSIAIQIPETAPPFDVYKEDIHQGNFETSWPVLKILLRRGNNVFDRVNRYRLEAAEIDVDVKGVKDLFVQKDNVVLDAGGPFLPFGTQAPLNSNLYVSNAEVFQKKLHSLNLRVKWKEPPSDFSEHYQSSYQGPSGTVPIYGNINNNDFKYEFAYLYNKQWLLQAKRNLFDALDAQNPVEIKFDHEFGFKPATKGLDYSRSLDFQEVEPFNAARTKNGFVRITLKEPKPPAAPFTAFGHKEYPRLLSRQAIALGQHAVTQLGEEPPIPNEPYTPEIETLTLNYASTQDLRLVEDQDQFFVIGPFGHQVLDPQTDNRIVPQYPEQAYLLIGVEELVPPQNLNVLLRLVEGSGNPNLVFDPADISWSYLAGDEWVALSPLSILLDSTENFQKSGVISLSVGREATSNNKLVPGDLHWLRIGISNNPESINQFVNFKAQGIDAALVLESEIDYSQHLQEKLPAEQISKLVSRRAAIKKVIQPYKSFGGQPVEDDNLYYTRISERLRHKGRALTIWDYERLVLDEFSFIFKVKCLNHTRLDTLMAPGCITVIVIPNLRSEAIANPLQPGVNQVTLNDIHKFLLQFANPFIRKKPEKLTVENPLYEQILLDFKVSFLPGLDAGFHRELLNEDLKRFLSPWAFEEGQDIEFGGRIYRSDILAFVESRSYVDYVTDFQMFHNFDSNDMEIPVDPEDEGELVPPLLGDMAIDSDFVLGRSLDEINAVSPRSILVSFPDHRITVLESGETACQGITEFGLGQMTVGIDFEVDLQA